MDKVEVLIIGYGSNLGGIETFIFNLIKNSDLNRFHYSFLSNKGSTPIFYDELVSLNCNFYEITTKSQGYSKYLKDLKDLYINNHFDIIHINMMEYARYERITYAVKYSNSKVILHSHIGSKAYLKQSSFITKFFDHIGRMKVGRLDVNRIACGNNAGKHMFGNKPFEVLYNGIDFDKYRFNEEARTKYRKEFNLDDNDFVFGNIATFIKFKNHPFLIDVFNSIHQKNNNTKLLLIGEGDQKEAIIKKVEDLGLSNDVLFLGKRYDANLIYSAMDIFVLPSFTEGLSISLCEAQINGLKCYATLGTDADSNMYGNLSFLDLNQGAEYWANTILNGNNDRINDLSKYNLERFDLKECCNKLIDYYDKILRN